MPLPGPVFSTVKVKSPTTTPDATTLPDDRTPDPLLWARIKAVFLDALDQPPDRRVAFLARECADNDELRRQVESLLASDAAAASFCEVPAAALLAGSGPPPSSAQYLQPGTRLGAYEITAFIGAGGMGDVYRARHTLLGRDVALKTVRASLADESARRRLLREARHAAQLEHPGVCTIHEVGEAEGGPFIVMEYVAGRTLAEVVRERRPALEDALGYGIQVASALQHAHERGIVHRDLKSSNVMVAGDGRAIVLDFGLARRVPGADGGASRETTVTQLGALAGTLSHMAPEMLLGREGDVRGDIWALGVLLYELVTGALPFRGRTPYETTSAILGEPIPPMDRRVPLALRLVIERCLMKRPEERYRSAGEVGAALDAIRRRRSWSLLGPLLLSARRQALIRIAATIMAGAGLLLAGAAVRDRLPLLRAPVSTLALLPLRNATGDPADQYYADGVTDALIAQLGAATDVRITSPASAAAVARTASSPGEIARRLGAAAIVQGSLRRRAGTVTIDLQLVRPRDGRVLWRQTFERSAREVLALQADVVRALALEVRLAVRPDAGERLATVRAVAPEVYEEYLKGRYEWNQRTNASLDSAVAHFTRAVALDPTYAPAHAALADCYSQLGTVMVGRGSPREYRPRAAAEAIKALQLDPYSAEAHASLGYTQHYDWQWADAERELRRALELNPSYSMAHIWFANLLVSLGRIDEGLTQVYAARELDPFSLIVNTNLAWTLGYAGRRPEAISALRRALELDSTYVQARMRLSSMLLAAGQVAEAGRHANWLIAATGRAPPALAAVADVALAEGRPDSARVILDELLERARTGYVAPYTIAVLYRALGDGDSAIAWMAKAVAERSNGIAYLRYDSVGFGRDPRYRALLERAGVF